MGTIREKMTADLDLRGFAATTKREYLQRAHNFIAYHRRPPTELGEQHIREFLLYLVNERKTGSATQHMYVAAIKFLYTTTLDRPQVVANIPWPKRPQTLPDIRARSASWPHPDRRRPRRKASAHRSHSSVASHNRVPHATR